jgi:hypothetical protein
MSFDITIRVVQTDKFNNMEILDEHKMTPKRKVQMNMNMLLCKMILMPIVHPMLKIDILKMEHVF